MKCYKMRSFKDKKPSPLNSEKVNLQIPFSAHNNVYIEFYIHYVSVVYCIALLEYPDVSVSASHRNTGSLSGAGGWDTITIDG